MNLNSKINNAKGSVIPHAHTRMGTTPNIHKRHANAQNGAAQSMQYAVDKARQKSLAEQKAQAFAKLLDETAGKPTTQSGARNKRKVVTALPDLPLDMMNPEGKIASAIESLDWFIVHGKNPKPKMTEAIDHLRSELKKGCAYYEPESVESLHVSGMPNHTFPVFADGKGILCASGTPGHAVYRGAHCTRKCVVSDVQQGRSDGPAPVGFVSLESIQRALDVVPQHVR